MEIFVCESGEYEQRSIDFVCATIESGIARLKEIYKDPYVVKWGEPVKDSYWEANGITQYTIIGDFEAVLGKSIKHRAEFSFTQYQVQ